MYFTHIILSSWLSEFVKHPEVYPFLISLGVWLIYLIFFIFREKWFKGRFSFLQKLFNGWIVKLSTLGLIAWGFGLYSDYDKRIKKEIEYACVSDDIKLFVDNLMSDDLRRVHGNLSEISPGLKENFGKSIKKDFKAIAFIQDEDGVSWEERLNDELKRRDQYTAEAKDLDYLVIFFQDWKTDLYSSNSGRFGTCSTENGFIEVIEFKSSEVIDTVSITRDANPSSFTSSSEYGGKTIELQPGELYNIAFGK